MGYVMQFPDEDRMAASRNMLLDRVAVALAGRATEQMVFEDVTTGAQNDFEQATEIARRMVTRWGMSRALGNVALATSGESYLGDVEGPRSYSEETARVVDGEIRAILDAQYRRVEDLLRVHRDQLQRIVDVLLVRETLHADEFEMVLRGETLPEPQEAPEPAPAEPARAAGPASGRSDEAGQEPRLPPGMMPKPG
jgi:cell division protease FtsH